MPGFKKYNKHKGKPHKKGGKPRVIKKKAPKPPQPTNLEETGEEAAYLKWLIDSGKPIVVVLRTGEELRGQMRYYDRDVFSLGPENGPKLFLRKDSVRYLYEA